MGPLCRVAKECRMDSLHPNRHWKTRRGEITHTRLGSSRTPLWPHNTQCPHFLAARARSLSLSLHVHYGGCRPLCKTASSVSRAFSEDQSMQTLHTCSSLQQRFALVPESVAEGTHALSKTLALRENSSRKKSAPERSQWRFQWPLAL